MSQSKRARQKETFEDCSSRIQSASKPSLVSDDYWNLRFFELMLYKAKHGNVHVSHADEKHKDLYNWLIEQRQEYTKFKKSRGLSILNEDRIKVLQAENFSFETRNDERWFHQFDQLKQFKERYGHTVVPRNSEFPGLGSWVLAQRMQYNLKQKGKESQMNDQRWDHLEGIGFVWKIRNRPVWDARYEELLEFRSRHTHTMVPQNYPSNKALGKWVARQRMEYNYLLNGEKSLMTPERKNKLNEIGFAWYARDRSEDIDLDTVQRGASRSM